MSPRRLGGITSLALTATVAAACGQSPAVKSPAAHAAGEPGAAALGFHAVSSAPAVAMPVRVRLPAIGVDAPVEQVGQAADGTVAVPRRWGDVGWYAAGPRPGASGPAVLLGHVDSTAGPAVFYRLRELHRGDVVDVVRADATVVRFTVTRVARYPKARFPTSEVYLPTLVPQLRLVTCGGAFDFSTGHYVDNVIAYAQLLP